MLLIELIHRKQWSSKMWRVVYVSEQDNVRLAMYIFKPKFDAPNHRRCDVFSIGNLYTYPWRNLINWFKDRYVICAGDSCSTICVPRLTLVLWSSTISSRQRPYHVFRFRQKLCGLWRPSFAKDSIIIDEIWGFCRTFCTWPRIRSCQHNA